MGLVPDVVLRHQGRGVRAMTASVVIPTFKRPTLLRNAVDSVLVSTLAPAEIVVVGRASDEETRVVVTELQARHHERTAIIDQWVTEPGHVPPVERGLQAASGDVVAIIDDDITVSADWLKRLTEPFDDPAVGVVGGRVVIPHRPKPALRGKPGQVTWYGKHWGNIGSVDFGGRREVCSVMEGNWAWRRQVIGHLRFDPILNFDDASMYGLDLCLQARDKGYRVLYEPDAVVFHHVAPRTLALDRRDRGRRMFAYCRNYTYIMLKHRSGWRRVAFVAWWFAIGERSAWGPGAIAADGLRGRFGWRGQVRPTFRGKVEGMRLWMRPR